MSLLPSLTFLNKNTSLYATQSQLENLSTSIGAVTVSTAQGAGISVTEPTANNFVFSNALSNAGGISFVTVPGSSTLGLSNAGVTSVAVGTGLSTSGATGSITLANTGVTSVSAGSGITLGGSSTAPSVTNAISASVNQILDVWNSTPIGAVTPVGGAQTTIVNYGSLTIGKTYLITICGEVACGAGTISAGDKGMYIAIQPNGLGEKLIIVEQPVSYIPNGFSATFITTMPQTGFNIVVGGDGTNTEIVSGTINNTAIVQLN